MKNALKIFLVLIVLLGLAAVLYFFNPLGFGKGKNATIAEIIHYLKNKKVGVIEVYHSKDDYHIKY